MKTQHGQRMLLSKLASFITRVEDAKSRCRLWTRTASVALNAGEAEQVHSSIESATRELQQIPGAIERGFATVSLATVCFECGLKAQARNMLQEVEGMCREERLTGPIATLELFLVDAISQSGEIEWALKLASEEKGDLGVEMLSGIAKRCAKLRHLKPMFDTLSDERLATRRNALNAEALILLAEAGLGDSELSCVLQSLPISGDT